MNIFILDEDPVLAAQQQCDRHVVKMTLETAQLLSTAITLTKGVTPGFYRMTHANHPCSIWTRTNRSNFAWLVRHGKGLAEEYQRRYSKVHKSLRVIEEAEQYAPLFPEDSVSPFALCMPEKYRVYSSAVECYRQFYAAEKRAFAVWKNSTVPAWFTTYTNQQGVRNANSL